MEQPAAAEPTAPAIEEPPVTGPTSPSGGAHDEGDPTDALGDEGVWAMAGVPMESSRVGAETTRPMVGSSTQDPPVAMEHAVPETSPVMEVSPKHSV